MKNQREYCENLYKRYKKIVGEIKLEVQDDKAKLEIPNIDLKEVNETIKVRNELQRCLEFLTNEQLKELFNDHDFMGEAIEILAERKRNSQS